MDDLEIDADGHLSDSQLQGNIAPGGSHSTAGGDTDGPDTLDEPVLTSITRDLKAIGQKLILVVFPNRNNILLNDWDLWGPLFLCMYIGLVLQGMSKGSESSRFTTVFLVTLIGTMAVTYNAIFVQRANISIFQTVCVIGYCLAPEAVVVTIFELFNILSIGQTFLRLLLVIASVAWSSYASYNLLRSSTEQEKKVVVMGPIGIFYVTLGLLMALYVYADS